MSCCRLYDQGARDCRGFRLAGPSFFPPAFGTVDQFAVKALAKIPELPERALIASMNPNPEAQRRHHPNAHHAP